jgi:hypothetical protein
MSITLLDHRATPRQAFVRGLLKGLAAPVMLFAANRAQIAVEELPPLPRIEPVLLPTSISSMTDMQRIGQDFWTVIRRYEQEDSEQPTVTGKGG